MADMAIHLDVSNVDQLLSSTNKQKAKLALANHMSDDMDAYVPLREGELRAHLDITPDRLSYGAVYARAQYYGTNDNGKTKFQNYTTEGTGPRWDKKAKAKYMDDWVDAFKKVLRDE